jgi:hypothetical protein
MDNAAGRPAGVLDSVVAIHIAHMYRIADNCGFSREIDESIDVLEERVHNEPELVGKQKAVATLRSFREMCRGGMPRELSQSPLQQAQAPAPQPASAPAMPEMPVMPVMPATQQQQQVAPVPTLEDSLRGQQVELFLREWASRFGETLVRTKLQAMASNTEGFHPPVLQVVDVGNGESVLLAPSSTRIVQGRSSVHP